MLTDGFDDIEERSFTGGGFADVYRATYKGQPVVVKALETNAFNLRDVNEVSGLIFCAVVRSVYVMLSVLCKGGRRVEMAST